MHSRANLAHTGGSHARRLEQERRRNAVPHGQCHGCETQARDGWEHAHWCPKWLVREGSCSGA